MGCGGISASLGWVPTGPDPDSRGRGGAGTPSNKVGGWTQLSGSLAPFSPFLGGQTGFELQDVWI